MEQASDEIMVWDGTCNSIMPTLPPPSTGERVPPVYLSGHDFSVAIATHACILGATGEVVAFVCKKSN